MTFKLLLPLFLFFVTPIILLAQDTDIDQVTTAIEQQVINTFEGFPPMPFEAPDTEGNRHVLTDYKGKVVILYFWSVEEEKSYMSIPLLERLKGEYPTEVVILTMAKEDEMAIENFQSTYPFRLPIIPNTDELGNMGFAGELGDPRIFVIDTFGVINELFIGKHMTGPTDLYQLLKPHVEAMLK